MFAFESSSIFRRENYMLDNIWAMSALYSKPQIKFAVDCYARRLKMLMSFDYNTGHHHGSGIFDRIITLNDRIDNLKLLSNILASAYNLLKEDQKKLIGMIFFECLDKDSIMRETQYSLSEYKYRKRVALKKFTYYLTVLGLDNERFISLFNDEPLILRNVELATEMVNKANRFHKECLETANGN